MTRTAVRRRRGSHAPRPAQRAPVRILDRSELATRIINLPSRQHMQYPLRKDIAEHLDRVYRALVRRSQHAGSAAFDTTWAQLAEAAGATARYPLASMQRWMAMLAEAGLVHFGGVKDGDGAWQRLDVTLLEPPPLSSALPAGVAQSVRATPIRGRRRGSCGGHLRPGWRRPHCPEVGRRGAPPRIFFRPQVHSPEGLSLVFDQEQPEGNSARARAGRDALKRSVGLRAVAALEAITAQVSAAGPGRERSALEAAAREHPAVPVAVALAAWLTATGGAPPLLSGAMRRQLERSAAQFDRLHGAGAAGRWFVDRIGGIAGDDAQDGRVRSLTYYVLQLKQLARQSRRQRRGAPRAKRWKSRQPKGAHAAW